MIIVGFTYKTSKILPRIFCRRFRHCAPVVIEQHGKMVLHQFIRHNNIEQIPITMRDLRLLRAHGWTFVCIPNMSRHHRLTPYRARTCVELTCHIIGIHGLHPITPYGLYRKIKKFGNI